MRLVFPFALVVGFVLSGCHCGGETLVVRRVLVDVDPAAVAAGVDREKVRAGVAEVLAHTRNVTVDESSADAAVLRVRVESFVRGAPALPQGHPPAENPPSLSSLSLTLDVTVGGRPALRGVSQASAQGVNDPHALIDQAVREALAQALQTRDADQLDSDELLSWLTAPDASTDRKRRAMIALGSRRERRATATLVAILQADDETLAPAALQALTLLGDEDAVDGIIAWSDRQPVPLRKMCIDAVKATGSKRAVPWLFTLSTGHADVEIQAHAHQALLAIEGPVVPLVAEQTRPAAAIAPAGGANQLN